jgi:asparagine synthase (glutamine-hydrolysing)
MDAALAAIYDPQGRLASGETERRLRRAIEANGNAAVFDAGALTVGSSGRVKVRTSMPNDRCAPLVVSDGDVQLDPRDQPAAWLVSLRASPGAFAVVAWHAGRGLIARDHLGARPLFFMTAGSVVYAASEVGLLLALLSRRPEPDDNVLALFLARHPPPSGKTVFAGLRALPPAHALILDDSGPRLERFWRPEPRRGLEHVDHREAAALVRGGAIAAVERHGGTRPDAGVLLSGGLDSNSVLACAATRARITGRSAPPAFTGVFPDTPELDERVYASRTTERWGAPWTTVPVVGGTLADQALEHLERWQVPVEYPAGLLFTPVRAEASRKQVGVLLDGEGGDELFGCEPLLLADRVLRGDVRGAVRLARNLPGTQGRLDARHARAIARRCVLPGLLSPRLVDPLRRIRRDADVAPSWLRAPARASVTAAIDVDRRPWWRAGQPRWRAHLGYVLSDEISLMSVHDHLRRTSAAAGIVGAHPFLDVDLIELVLGLPPELAFEASADRPLLREAMTGMVPDPVRLRHGKVYFDRLLLDALTGPDRPVVERLLGDDALELGRFVDTDQLRALWHAGPSRHPRGRSAWSAEIWRAFSAEAWLRREASNGSLRCLGRESLA